MHLAGRPLLEVFLDRHADVRSPIAAWIEEVEGASWQSPHEVKARYPSASMLGEGIVVFNIKGNAYRLECRVSYQHAVVRAMWIGTHAEYTKRS